MEQISLLDLEGVMVGQASDATAGTGCSVVLCPSGALGAVDVRGGAPATRETDLLRPDKANQEVHAVVLAGGSAFGLDACSGVARWLEERRFGFDVGVGRVPIVCGASLFDLAYGSAAVRPDARMGYEACEDAFLASAVTEGNVGAGTGATVGKMCGSARAMKSGVGTYGLAAGDLKVAALVAVNALGCVVDEHGAVLAGGHSISSDEPLYGLAVTGFVNPAAMWKNAGARAGDALILTKQIGTGVVNTAFKGEAASDASEAEAIHVMRSLNAKARDVLAGFSVHACTDITGFGLIGHSLEMARAGGVTLEIRARSVPLITGAADYAEEGFVPAGAYRNRDYMQDCVDEGKISRTLTDLLYDPQTSGGLLFAVSDEDVPDIMHALAGAGMETKTALVGHAVKAQTKAIRLR